MLEMQPRSTTHYLDVPGSTSNSSAGLMGYQQKEGNTAKVRQRSVSNATPSSTGYGGGYSNDYEGESGGLRRSNTTGKTIAQSLKRRLGSLKRK